ncbi:Glyoxylate/hydroxypyruvate reductase B [Seminavis robusta]|uniref:Glyoxylate/hydroxypyruvate reductase B n=1 Tax=Seminavis robusta TaxID=568900 RepID=A0A9N8DJ05_9STRA|nr:Glyoxylate/hydroxypyruvate reductase B [Seminavis robusta]|eukprot:Sro178_g078220.1 Glyoxylate/hydroxypyruvate reductase B (871) ;mRNA; f:67736-70588
MTAGSPVAVADSFHFSHYYWREIEQTGSQESSDDENSTAPAFKPKPVASNSIKLKFYAQVMGDASEQIHFGKWNNIDESQPDAYGKASEAMTDYMFDLAKSLLPHRVDENDFTYVDLGSGTGAAAIRLCEHNPFILQATCLNLCHAQNMKAMQRAKEAGLGNRLEIVDGSFEDVPTANDVFDLAFSQDAFIHSVSKKRTFAEAYRIVKPGGALVFCDLMNGADPDVSVEEHYNFTKSNVVNDWLTPEENMQACRDAGWRDVQWVDLTTDIRISFQRMLKKVTFALEHGHAISNSDRVQLMDYRDSIFTRITQIDRGLFKWAVIHARKPVYMELACKPPVPFVNTNGLVTDLSAEESNDTAEKSPKGDLNVVVVDIITKMPKAKIDALPSTVELLITMSAGLDHIDMEACAAKGITVKQSGRESITEHVVQYALGFLILALRDAFNQISVPFPAKGWNLNWNCEGKPITDSTIAIVGMGLIAKQLVEQIRKIAPNTRICYHVPACFKDVDAEEKYNLEYCATLEDMAADCDVLLPLCPLSRHTEGIISREVLNKLKPTAGFVNIARGGLVDHEALTEILEKNAIKYALLDTTFPEPLPADHRLWGLKNCYIFPHYATNTMAVREALVNEIQPIIEEHYGLGHSDEKLRKEECALRYDLAVAHRLTAKYGMDMLVWNHISARFRTGCLITPGRKMWSKINPSDLVFSSSNVTADIIHDAIYAARPNCKAIIHLHTPAATAVSCLESGFIPFTQDSAYFYGKVANYEWDGVSDDASEGPAITAAVRSAPNANTLLMNNHGFVCFGSSVREVWVLAYYFERCCQVQLDLLKTGAKVRMPNKAVMEKAAATSYLPEFAPGVCEWEALCEEVTFDE